MSTTTNEFRTIGIDPTVARDLFLGTFGDAPYLETLIGWWELYSIIAILFSFLCIIAFIYTKIRLAQLSEIEQESLREAEAQWARSHGAAGVSKNTKWADVLRHVSSDNPNDWRLAIIEADIMLEEILRDAGYVGTTIGEQLKTASPQSFQSLEDAWSAHKVRNQIAHSGSDFVLTKKRAQETILQYERVFREFGSI